MIDTHAHIYTKEFDEDLDLVIQLAKDSGVKQILMPNIDLESYSKMIKLADNYPGFCLPMAGVHPCDIKEGYEQVLDKAYGWLQNDSRHVAVGETGMDLYWDKSFLDEQKVAFSKHLQWGKEFDLPVVIHVRDAFDEVFNVVEKESNESLYGVFHCFSGNYEQAIRAIDLGFHLGLGGVLTCKNSGLDEAIKKIDLEHIILETDSPYLAPVPYRGKRNEPSFITEVLRKLADIKGLPYQELDEITTENARNLFNLK